MKSSTVCVLVVIATLGLAASAGANPVDVYTVTNPIQDDWTLNGPVEELGLQPPFPTDERITAVTVAWQGWIPCPAEYHGGGAVQIQMTNLTGKNWTNNVYYVADPETSLSNWDELVGQVGYGTGLAFKIDSIGENRPLLSESMIADNIFQAGETWEFVIQEYSSGWAGSAADFSSLGIAGASSGPPSTGSIVVPEPSTVALVGLSLVGMLAVIRRKK